MIGRKLLHYDVIESLGEGGMGVVYKAMDTRLNRPVALKFIAPSRVGDPQDRARLVNEARSAASLRHPNICTVYDIGETPDGQTFISMAYLEGESLRDRIQKQGRLPVDETIRLVSQIAEGLREAHARGVVHRDIKSANILLTDRDEAVILDFGLAKLPASGTVTQTDTFSGTVAYSSPEQIRGERVDQRTDLWSLGVVWYEMLTGALPFAGETIPSQIRAVLDTAPSSIRSARADVPAGVERVLSRLLAKTVAQRTPDASTLLADIRALRSGAAAEGPKTPSIAVLPFANMSNDPEQSYFCDGIAEDIINDLTRIEGLRVAARTTSFAHRASSVDIREIGGQIGVDSVLEGSVRKAGNRLRITAQLIDVSNGYHIWSERWDRDLADVFAIQDEIAHAITAALRVKLTEKEQSDLGKQGTKNLEAYDMYLRAGEKMHRARADRLVARDLLRKAIALDPSYARAHARLAVLSMFLYQYLTADPKYLQESLEEAPRALALDPNLAEARAARGYALAAVRRFDEAEPEFAESLRLNPDLYETIYFLARVRWVQGRPDEAMVLFERAAQIDPNEYQAACLMINMSIALNPDPEYTRRLALRAIERVERHLAKVPDDTRAVYLSVSPLQALGRIEEATAQTEKSLVMDPEGADVQYNAACYFALQGVTERALDCLERAIDVGFNTLEWIQNDPDLDSLRATDRYQKIVKRLSSR
jgi:non-specific serine/threonine protein kinase